MPSDDTPRRASTSFFLWAWFRSLLTSEAHPHAPMPAAHAKRTVVIVGGGNAGTHAAHELSKKLDPARYTLLVVTPRPFYVHLPAMARMPVSAADALEDRALFGYETLFVKGNGALKIGTAVAIHERAPGEGGELELADGERIPYAALVIATGCVWPSIIQPPSTEAEVRAHLETWRGKVKRAKHVVVVGGGAVGIGACSSSRARGCRY